MPDGGYHLSGRCRSWLLKNHGWDVERDGLAGSPPISIFCGARHATIDRSLRFTGLGDVSLKPLRTNPSGLLDPSALEQALKESGGRPALVLLQAGDINTGGFDDFDAPDSHHSEIWRVGTCGWRIRHVGCASPRYENLVSGMGRAFLGHRRSQVAERPFDCGYSFVAEREAHRASMSYRRAISRIRVRPVIRLIGIRSSLDAAAAFQLCCLARTGPQGRTGNG